MKQLFYSLVFAIGATVIIAGSAFAQGSGGVSGPAFYVEGSVYRTVATPAELDNTGAPDHSFDTIYNFGGNQMNVATSAPGLPDYNGGRWQVHALAFPNGYAAALAAHDINGNGVFDTNAEVYAALADGSLVDTGIVRMFVCTVIKIPNNS